MADPVWEAVRFEGVQRTGRTRPLLFECERSGAHGVLRERFVVKALGLPEIFDFSLCHELLGGRLAQLFGLAAPPHVLVNVSEEFLEAARGDLAAAGLGVQSGIAVGSQFIPNLLPFPAIARISMAEATDAALVYVFDLMMQNPDRRSTNPNCGRAGGRIVPFDFESAFSFRFGLLNPDPWNVAALPFGREHLFHSCVREFDDQVDWPSSSTASGKRRMRPLVARVVRFRGGRASVRTCSPT